MDDRKTLGIEQSPEPIMEISVKVYADPTLNTKHIAGDSSSIIGWCRIIEQEVLTAYMMSMMQQAQQKRQTGIVPVRAMPQKGRPQ